LFMGDIYRDTVCVYNGCTKFGFDFFLVNK